MVIVEAEEKVPRSRHNKQKSGSWKKNNKTSGMKAVVNGDESETEEE